MNESVFTNNDIAQAWLSYGKACAIIQEKLDNHPEMDAAARKAFQSLMDSHKDKRLCLERAQRIINTSKALEEKCNG